MNSLIVGLPLEVWESLSQDPLQEGEIRAYHYSNAPESGWLFAPDGRLRRDRITLRQSDGVERDVRLKDMGLLSSSHSHRMFAYAPA